MEQRTTISFIDDKYWSLGKEREVYFSLSILQIYKVVTYG